MVVLIIAPAPLPTGEEEAIKGVLPCCKEKLIRLRIKVVVINTQLGLFSWENESNQRKRM